MIRNEIECIIKEFNISRTRFHEVSKQTYASIIKKTEDTFTDRTRYWKKGLSDLNTIGKFKSTFIIDGIYAANDWVWYHKLPEVIENPQEPVFMLINGNKIWVYEGYLQELILILDKADLSDDYYIVSKKFKWLITLNYHFEVKFVGNGLNLNCFRKR